MIYESQAFSNRIRRYDVWRENSGAGKWHGGKQQSKFSDSKYRKPGVSGRNSIVNGGQVHELQTRIPVTAPEGSIVRIETPGGERWGKSED
ncbi:MAG: hypothetical protein ACFFER_04010 [Candidatus Thorarchaeota archaeon]